MQNEGNLDVRILVVDDMAPIRKLVVSSLRSIGYRNLAVARDGVQAWEIVQKEKIDLVISDWLMPRMSGIELLHKLRAESQYENMPFIMLTGNTDQGNIALAAETDVDTVLAKPFYINQLADKIKLVLDRKYNPTIFQKLLDAGRKKQRDCDYEEALQYYYAAISIRPNRAIAYYGIGQVKADMGDHEEAKEAYKKTLSINPQFIKALDGLADIYSIEGDKENLYEVLNTLIDMSPKNAERQFKCGRLALEVGDKEKAKGCLIKATQLDPDNGRILYEVGKLFFDHDMIQDAEILFDKVMTRQPEDITSLNHIGDVLRMKKQYDKAKLIYWKSLRIQENATTHFKLAQLYIDVGSKRMAHQHLESALVMDREFKAAMDALYNLDELIAGAKKSRSKQ
jgi:two-component system, chemotaxis family, chemotaxis protein CheY